MKRRPPRKWKHPKPQRRQWKKRRLHRKQQFPQNPPNRQRQRKPRNRKRKSQNRKSTNTGNHLGGWKFIVKKDGAEIPNSPFTTDETGIIRISNLAPGKYVILESPTDDPYWTAELGYHTVTVEYGKTAVDQWLNKEQGLGCFTKSTNTGDEISGWHITVYADEACTQELHTLITGQDGTACIYLEPGTYWVKETGSEDVRDDYWKMDDSVKQLVIRAHDKTTLEFVNNYSGRIAIRKSVEPEGTLEGWKFRITDADGKEVSGSPFITDKDGKILTGNLTPGEYTVEEVLPADSLYTGKRMTCSILMPGPPPLERPSPPLNWPRRVPATGPRPGLPSSTTSRS